MATARPEMQWNARDLRLSLSVVQVPAVNHRKTEAVPPGSSHPDF